MLPLEEMHRAGAIGSRCTYAALNAPPKAGFEERRSAMTGTILPVDSVLFFIYIVSLITHIYFCELYPTKAYD